MAIRVIRNDAGNCVNFLGSSNPVYWNACLSAEVDSTYSDRINVINDIRTVIEGDNVYEFFQVPYTDFATSSGIAFSNATEAAEYITAQCNVASNTGSFVLSDTDSLNFAVDSTSTTVLLSNGDSYAVNSIQALANEDDHINIVKHTSQTVLYKDLRWENVYINNDDIPSANLNNVVNALNSLFTNTASISGVAPSITSNTTINLTAGETLNYELTATNGVAYEWSGLPSGVATVDGNVRKLIGGSSLATGAYTITAKAINYYGEDTQTLTLNVAAPPYSNTKSVEFDQQDYLGANASLLDPTLGRSSNGTGSGDAWTIAFWFKGSTYTSNTQTILYFGDHDTTNGGHILLRYRGSDDSLFFRYGSNNNYLKWVGANNLTPAGTWKHVTITYDGGTTGASSGDINSYYGRFAIFVDGVDVTSGGSWTQGNYGWSSGIDPDNFRIGRYDSGAYLRDNVRIDELAIWDSDRTANVSGIYNSGTTHDLSQLTNPPKHWWRMGDGDTYPYLQDNGTANNCVFQMYNMTAASIVTDAP